MADYFAPGRLGLGIEAHLLHHLEHDLLVRTRLLEILLPLFLELVVDRALERGLVDLNTALLGLESLIQELRDLFVLHWCFPPGTPASPAASYRQAACRS